MKDTVVLAVDDDAHLLAVLRDGLSSQGFSVVLAENGAEALERLARHSVDIVVTDLAMPGMNGLQLARRCKQLKPALPIVMLTAWDLLITDEERVEHGLDAVVPKPVRLDELAALLRELVAAAAKAVSQTA
jgi:two-component system response regulator MprA